MASKIYKTSETVDFVIVGSGDSAILKKIPNTLKII